MRKFSHLALVWAWAQTTTPRQAPSRSSTEHSRRQIYKQISMNYSRDGHQKDLITFSLSNGRVWPLMWEGLHSLLQAQRWLLVLELSFFFFFSLKRPKHANGQKIPRNGFTCVFKEEKLTKCYCSTDIFSPLKWNWTLRQAFSLNTCSLA